MDASLKTHLKADDVCAFLWKHTDRSQRAVTCTIAGVEWHPTVDMEWHEIDKAERAELVAAFVDQVETETPQAAVNMAEPGKQQLAIALAKLWNQSELWCELDWQAVEFVLGHPLERTTWPFSACEDNT